MAIISMGTNRDRVNMCNKNFQCEAYNKTDQKTRCLFVVYKTRRGCIFYKNGECTCDLAIEEIQKEMEK